MSGKQNDRLPNLVVPRRHRSRWPTRLLPSSVSVEVLDRAHGHGYRMIGTPAIPLFNIVVLCAIEG